MYGPERIEVRSRIGYRYYLGGVGYLAAGLSG